MCGCVLTDIRAIERLRSSGHSEVVLFPDLLALPPEFIHSAGFVAAGQAAYQEESRRRGEFELATIRFTLGGRSRLVHEGREFFVEAGDVMVLYSQRDQRSKIDVGEGWEFLFITLCGRAAVRGMREITANMGPVFALDQRSRALATTASACAAVVEGSVESPRRASELAHAIVSCLQSETLEQINGSTVPRPAAPELFADVEQFCLKNLSRPIGVEDMARVAKMSRYYFTRKFGKKRGISPGQYLAALRLDEAKRLLSHGGLTVKEVAMQCGYSDANYFGKVFRKNLGVSPGSLRVASMQRERLASAHSSAA
jgi:AraC-like DNA-binding protein